MGVMLPPNAPLLVTWLASVVSHDTPRTDAIDISWPRPDRHRVPSLTRIHFDLAFPDAFTRRRDCEDRQRSLKVLGCGW